MHRVVEVALRVPVDRVGLHRPLAVRRARPDLVVPGPRQLHVRAEVLPRAVGSTGASTSARIQVAPKSCETSTAATVRSPDQAWPRTSTRAPADTPRRSRGS